MASSSSNEEDDSSFYAVLNVARDASEEDIKRAFRQLAQAYHPDKHTDASLQADASANFARLQEAYEVLSNPERRQVYDIYGKEGLSAGLEVGSTLKSTDELRQDWENFKAQQRLQMQVSHRGFYSFKVDATSLVDPYDRHVSIMPEVYEVAMNSQISSPISDNTVATLGGQMAVQGNVGGGSFVCGLKRILTPHDSIDMQCALGLKTFASVQSTRQLSEHTSAGLGVTWQPRVGLGLQLLSSRELSDNTSADFNWVIGPAGAAGAGLSLSRRGEKFTTTGRIEVGAVTGIQARCVWRVSQGVSARVALRVGTTGVDLEVGGTQRISEFSAAGLAVAVGLYGVVLKPRFTRGTHTFDFPLLLSHDPRAWRVLLGAYVLPPLAVYVTKRHIIRPLRRWRKTRQRLEKEMELLEDQRTRRAAAAGACRVMEPVAKRKLRKEIQKGGLVVVDAKYGAIEAIMKAEAEERERARSSGAATSDADVAASTEQAAGTSAGEEAEVRGEDEAAVDAAVAAQLGSMERPPPWIDVTIALRFMTEDSRIVLHKVSKRGLMGFCDPVPDEEKHLRMRFLWHGRPYVATLGDKEEGQLPARGKLVTDEAEAAALLAAAAAQDLLPDQAGATWRDNALYGETQ
ncbi:DnaJ homolog subfamily C member 11 [Coccomyxa sp. Obi]|nr:DnaJ homolog subfamily C member 11 [Coccomyxa sp. Obi]